MPAENKYNSKRIDLITTLNCLSIKGEASKSTEKYIAWEFMDYVSTPLLCSICKKMCVKKAIINKVLWDKLD